MNICLKYRSGRFKSQPQVNLIGNHLLDRENIHLPPFTFDQKEFKLIYFLILQYFSRLSKQDNL